MQQAERLAPHDGVLGHSCSSKRRLGHYKKEGIQSCLRALGFGEGAVSSTGDTSLRLTRRRSSMAVMVSRSVDKDVFQ